MASGSEPEDKNKSESEKQPKEESERQDRRPSDESRHDPRPDSRDGEPEPTPEPSHSAPADRIAGNFIALGSGETIGRGFAFLATLILARVLGVESYGVLALAAGITLYLAKISDFAIETVGTGEVTRRPQDIAELGGAVMGLRLLITVGLAAGAAGLAGLFLVEPERSVFWIYLLTLFPIAASTRWIHLGTQSAGAIGLWRGLGELGALLFVVLFVRGPEHLTRAPFGIVLSEGIAAIALYLLLRRRGQGFGLRFDLRTALPIFRKSFPVMLQILLGLLVYNADLVFLRVLVDREAVGYYAAAYTLVSFAANLGVALGMSLLPAFARQEEESEGARRVYGTAIAQAFSLCLPLAVGGTFLASDLIRLGFGESYQSSAGLLQVLLWSIPLLVCRNVAVSALVMYGETARLVRITAFGVVLNGLLNFFLIRELGTVGAAIATVITEGSIAIGMLAVGRRHALPFFPWRRIGAAALATTAMAAALVMTTEASIFLRLPLGLSVFGLALFALGGLRFEGRKPILDP